MYAYTYAHTRTRTRMRLHTRAHAHALTRMPTHARAPTHTHTHAHAHTYAHACALVHTRTRLHAHTRARTPCTHTTPACETNPRSPQQPIKAPKTTYSAFFSCGVTRCSITRRKRLKTAVFQPCNGYFSAMHTIGAPIPAHNGQTIDAPMHRRDNARRYINEKTRTRRVKGLVCYWLRDALIASLSA